MLGVGVASAGVRVDPTEMYVNYTGPTTVQITVGGSIIRTGGSVPAGLYTVLVYENGYNSTPRFTMTGPGVSISSDLNSTGMGVDGVSAFGPYTFSSGASYTVQQVGGAAVTFSTTAASGGSSGGSSSGGSTGGSSAGGSSGGSSSGGTSGGSSGGTKTGSGSSMSTGTKMMGTLKGVVSVSGKGTLTFAGKAAKTLKAGRYTVSVDDQSKKVGLIVGQTAKKPITISAAATVGKSSHSVTLSAGKWYFAASTSGPKTYFTVTS